MTTNNQPLVILHQGDYERRIMPKDVIREPKPASRVELKPKQELANLLNMTSAGGRVTTPKGGASRREGVTMKSGKKTKTGVFGIGVFHSKTDANIGTLLRSAHCFGASFVYTVGRRYKRQSSDTTNAAKHIPLFHYVDIDDLVAHLPLGCSLVGVEIDELAMPLPDVKLHPASACYILGAEDNGLTEDAIQSCHRLMSIPGAKYCLNVSVAGSIVLYDRIAKGIA